MATSAASAHRGFRTAVSIEIQGGRRDPQLRRACECALAAAGADDGHLSITLVARDEIRDLNRRFRGSDSPTDVLSFPVDGLEPSHGPRELGDIVICPQDTDDLTTAVVHGVLHLCGYDHETDRGEMLALERRVVAELNASTAARERLG